MYDPDNKERTKIDVLAKQPKQAPPEKVKEVPLTQLTPREEAFRFYCKANPQIREAHGVRVHAGKIEVTNAEALAKLSETERRILREVCKELVSEYNASTRFWDGGRDGEGKDP